MPARPSFIVCILAKFVALSVIVCLFACNLSAAVGRLASMSPQAVHDTVARLGVGKGVSARISSSGSGRLQFTNTWGRIVAITDTSFDLSVKDGDKVSVQRFAYEDIDEIHGAPISGKRQAMAIVFLSCAVAAIVVAIFKHHTPAPGAGGPNT